MTDYATLLRDHTTLTCRSVDRIFLQGYVPGLQTPGLVARFLLHYFADTTLAPLKRALAELTTAAESIKKYVDRHVAHRDRRPLATIPTFVDLNEAIDLLGELSGKCELLLHGADRLPMPVVLGDVMDAFSVPWVPAKPRLSRSVPSGTPGS